MCLTAQAMAVFLNLLDPAIIDTGADRITVNATVRRAVWVKVDEDWCSDAPKRDRIARNGA